MKEQNTSKENEKSLEEITQQKIEKRLEKLEKQNQKVKQQNEELQKEVQKLKSRSNAIKTNGSSEKGISRRQFLKKAGLGTAGLAALISPVSALNINSDSFNVYTGADSGSLSHSLEIGQNGSVKIPNSNLQIQNGNLGIGTTNPSLPLEIHDTKGIKIPVGTNNERSTSPKQGELRINSEKSVGEVHYDGQWNTINRNMVPIDAEGGKIEEKIIDGKKYRIHSFENTGSATFEVNKVGSNGFVEVLIVAGGGAGGNTYGDGGNNDGAGGGGAGGIVRASKEITSVGDIDVYVGEGGEPASKTTYESGGNGENSKFGDITASGGGGGGSGSAGTEAFPYEGKDGGSGGGGGGGYDHPDGANNEPVPAGSGIENQGHDGGQGAGDGDTKYRQRGGGGGGAKEPATSAFYQGYDGEPTPGGNGIVSNIKGTYSIVGGGGGGGGDQSSNTYGARGGAGGGGAGGDSGGLVGDNSEEGNGKDGKANTGGGGGGAGGYDDWTGGEALDPGGLGGKGGSGIVIVRYPIE